MTNITTISGGDGLPGCCGVEGVYRQDGLWALSEDGFDDGEDAALFFFRGKRCSVRTSGFAAAVEDVGAFVEHSESVLYGAVGRAVGRVEVAAVGEAVGRDVQDAHDEGALAKRECAGAEVPVEVWPRGERHGNNSVRQLRVAAGITGPISGLPPDVQTCRLESAIPRMF